MTVNEIKKSIKKMRVGVVVSDKMDKTAVVRVARRTSHPKYGKTITISKNVKAHNDKNLAKKGDNVRLLETRPLSKEKHWRIIEIIKKVKM